MIWAIPATQVAHYSAIIIGLTAVLWFCGLLRGRVTLVIGRCVGAILILTHTRTALVGMIAGLLVAGLSLIVAKARVRKLFATAGAVAAIAIMSPVRVPHHLAGARRGRAAADQPQRPDHRLGPLLAFPRNKFQEIFGFGLSNSSFNGLPIDSNWLASYQAQGLFGVVICARSC